MTSSGVRLDRDGPVASVTLCRPDVLNAQTPQTWEQLREVGRTLPGDVRVVVVRGQGRAFSAGLDRSVLGTGLATELARLPDSGATERIAGFQAGFG